MVLDSSDLVFTNDDDGNITAAGFKIDTIFNDVNTPMTSVHRQIGDVAKSNIFDNLKTNFAIPAGLMLLNSTSKNHHIVESNDSVAPNKLIDRLHDLATISKLGKRNTTRKKCNNIVEKKSLNVEKTAKTTKKIRAQKKNKTRKK